MRDRECGVAMIEAVLALPVLLILFVACFYFHGAYRAKLRAHRGAMQAAWWQANAPDCLDGGSARSLGDLELDSNVASYVPGGGATVTRYARIETTAERAQPVPRFLHWRDGSFRARGRTVLTCNERADVDVEDTLLGVLGTLVGSLGSPPW